MQAVQVTAYGDADNLALCEVDKPEPATGEVLVRVHHAGVNFIDIYTREGVYRNSKTYANQPPFSIGREGSGVVAETGDQVTGFAPGERVAWCLPLGSYAEYALVPAWRLVKVPDDVPLPQATTLMLQGCTAHYLTHSLFPLQSGQRPLRWKGKILNSTP